MTIQSNSQPLRQAGIYATVVAASVALTLGSLWVFPKLLPSARKTEDSTVAEVIPSQTPALSNKQTRNFVATAVNRVEEAVVRIDTERTVATNFQNPFFEDPFYIALAHKLAFPINVSTLFKPILRLILVILVVLC